MKIAVDARVLTLKEIRGMASYLLRVIENWPDSSDCFFLLAENKPSCLDINTKSRVRWVEVKSPRGSRLHIWDWYGLPRHIGSLKMDIFWSPTNLCFPIRRVKQVVTIHDTLLQEYVNFKSIIDRFYFKHFIPWMMSRFASNVITVSKFSARRIERIFRMSTDKISVIYNGAPEMSVEARACASGKILMDKGLPIDNFIYALGAESSWKNTENLLKAFAIVKKETARIKFVVSGIQQRAMSRFSGLAVSLGLTKDDLVLLGFIEAELRNALYEKATCFVYPNIFEGFGLPPLEAMSFGTPVVASNAASIPEVVGNAALLVDAVKPKSLAKGIKRVLIDEILQANMKRMGLENVSRFSWRKSAKQHWACFNSLLN